MGAATYQTTAPAGVSPDGGWDRLFARVVDQGLFVLAHYQARASRRILLAAQWWSPR